MAQFALNQAIASVVKATDAQTGAIFSFWDPRNAILTSVELAEDLNMTFCSVREKRTAGTTVGGGGGGGGNDQNDKNSSVARDQFLNHLEQEMGSDEASPTPMKNRSNLTTSDNDDDSMSNKTNNNNAAVLFDNFSFSAPSQESAAQLAAAAAEILDQQQNTNSHSVPPATKTSISVTVPPLALQDKQTDDPLLTSRTILAGTMNNKLGGGATTQTLRRGGGGGKPSQVNSSSSFAAVNPNAITTAAPASAKAAASSAVGSLARCVAVFGEPSDLLLRASTPSITSAVAQSGLALHCTSNSAPFLVIPICAPTSAVEPLYSAVTKRLLQLNKFNLSHVVVGMLVLIAKEVHDDDDHDDDDVKESGGALPKITPAERAKRRVSKMFEDGSFSGSGTKKMATDEDKDDDDDDDFNLLFKRTNSLIGKRSVGFRAEDESTAELICRTVLGEILTTREGIFAKEQNLNMFLNKVLAQQQQNQENEQENKRDRSPTRKPTKGQQQQQQQQHRSQTLANQTTASFRQKFQQQDGDDANGNGMSSPAASFRLGRTTSKFQKAASAALASSLLGNTTSSNLNFQSTMMASLNNTFNSNNNVLTSSSSPQPLPSFSALGSFPAGHHGAAGNSDKRFPSQAAAMDWGRSTVPRRVPKIIRIPDSAIALTAKGVLSQRQGTFRALPDLAEVRRCIEEAESVIENLRDECMNLTLVSQRGGGGYSSAGGGGGGSLREGMEKLELRLSRMRTENQALRNHVDMLQHRLDTTLKAKSIYREFPPPSSPSSLGAHLFGDEQEEDDDDNDNDRRRPVSSAASSSGIGNRNSSRARIRPVPAPPSSSLSSATRPSGTSGGGQRLSSARPAATAAAGHLPASVMLEVKAVEGLEKLKHELALQRRQRKFNS